MEIIKTENNGKIIIQLDGWLDTAAAPLLGEETGKISSAKEIVLDFEKVEYISSSGLRQVVACYRRAKELNASFSIINVCEEAMTIFKMTGLDKKLTISEIN